MGGGCTVNGLVCRAVGGATPDRLAGAPPPASVMAIVWPAGTHKKRSTTSCAAVGSNCFYANNCTMAQSMLTFKKA